MSKPFVIKLVNLFKIFLSLLLPAIFFLRCLIYLDPDLGWHIRIGQLILQKGFIYIDPLSYTMPNYKFIDYEWLSNSILYILFSFGGNLLISFLFVLVIISIFMISIPKKYLSISLIPLICIYPILLSFSGNRPQLFSWLFITILIRIIRSTTLWSKFSIALPFLFLIWANMHASFLLGLGVLFIKLICDFITTNKIEMRNIFIFIISLLATVINPYGIYLWFRVIQETIITSTNPLVKYGINEWTPLISGFSPLLILILFASFLLLYKNRKTITIFDISIYAIFLFAAFLSRRHLPIWIIGTFSFHLALLETVWKYPKILTKQIIVIIAVVFICILTIYQTRMVLKNSYSYAEIYHYPKSAITYLKYIPDNTLFSPYDWAGYLELNLPEKKQFIDGRMPAWINPQANTVYESRWAYKDYNDFILAKINPLDTVNKYHIRYILWPKSTYKSMPFISILLKNNWRIVYQDPIAVIIHIN